MIAAERYAACQQLIAEFWGRLDRDDYEGLVALMVPDGRWNRAGKWREGVADIRAAMDERPEGLFVRHVITNLRCEDTPEGVLCRYYLTAFSTRSGKTAPPPYPAGPPSVLADYQSICVETPEGWRMKELSGQFAFRTASAA